jgi:hypothetical protein
MNESWGWRPTDTRYKSPRDLARRLGEVVSRGGNLLLNVSPKGDGSLPDVQVSHLGAVGAWIDTHGEAVIGVRPAPASVDFCGPATVRGNRLYLYLVAQPVENVVVRAFRFGVCAESASSVRMSRYVSSCLSRRTTTVLYWDQPRPRAPVDSGRGEFTQHLA